jgi:hypothetical protein
MLAHRLDYLFSTYSVPSTKVCYLTSLTHAAVLDKTPRGQVYSFDGGAGMSGTIARTSWSSERLATNRGTVPRSQARTRAFVTI